jgi:hypothetical protein
MRTVRRDRDEIIEDGKSVRVPIMLADSVAHNHQPHFYDAPTTNDATRRRAAARDAYVSALKDAWRTPHKDASERDAAERVLTEQDDPNERTLRRHLGGGESAEIQARRDREWSEYCDRVANAWRTDPVAATAIEHQGERWRGGR